jgi:glycosyltransferase involved in cell wall biosynthesis
MPKFKGLVCISKILQEKLAGKNANITYIPNGVDTELFKPAHHDHEFTVGFVGQKTTGGFGRKRNNEGIKVWDIKGYELLLQPLVQRLNKKVSFKILDNDSTNAIPHIWMPEWYANIDVLICTSLFEGCPLPVLEAAACGKPVISTRVGIVPELIEHGKNGYIVDPVRTNSDIKDALNWFETYILHLKANNFRCRMMGLENRERVVKKFDWGVVIKEWRKFFGTT